MEIETAAKTHISKVLKIQQDTLTCTEKNECEKCRDFMVLLDQIKEKCKKVNRKEKNKLLTLVPDSWTIQRTMDEFSVTEYIVKRARELKKEKGILGDVDHNRGKVLNPAVKERVQSFYENDNYSRMCPGKKEFVSVRIDDKREHKQKRLLLINLK